VTDYPRLSSRRHPLVRRFREAAAHAGGLTVLDGEHLVRDALDAGMPIDTLALVEDHRSGPLADLAARAAERRATVVAVPRTVLEALSPVRTPSGIVALAEVAPAPLERLTATSAPLLAVVAGVQDAGNVGAIIRAAEAFAATGIVCTEGTADPFGWKAMRGSMGSALRLPIAAREPLVPALRRLRASGLRLLAAVPREGTPLPSARLTGAAAIVLGAEGGGLPAEAVPHLDETVSIPMAARIDSLNVAVAAALILYEASRQRSTT
jgi:TrmH family RNA methyltransferase